MPDKIQTKQPPTSQSTSPCPYTVLGIAFVVEERGRGARLIIRYPVTSSNKNLFGTLPPRVMAKLFRLKHNLCNRPTTISVGDTVFCCRAVLLDDCSDDDASGTSNGSNNGENSSSGANDLLALFSVIVALGKSPGQNMNTGGVTNKAPTALKGEEIYTDNESSLVLSRVHLSLSQICQALEREERRSSYVTNQVAKMLPILDEYSQRQRMNLLDDPGSNHQSDMMDNKGGTADHKHHVDWNPLGDGGVDNSVDNEDLQAMFEDMLILNIREETKDKDVNPATTNVGNNYANSGNLAREMAEFYHCLSINDQDYQAISGSSLSVVSRLMGCGSIVNVNAHVGVHILPISESSLSVPSRSREDLRPYHTLLFPELSLLEVHRSLSLSKSAMPKRLQKLLLAISAQKSLNEISTDSALPLSTTFNLASQLIMNGVCIAAPVIRLSSRFACNHRAVQTMKKLALPFAQRFGRNFTIYMSVGMIVGDQRTIGEVLETLKKDKNLRAKIHQPAAVDGPSTKIEVLEGEGGFDEDESSSDDELLRKNTSLDQRFFEIVIWLRSRSVIIEITDYLISLKKNISLSSSDDKKEDSNDGGKMNRGHVESSSTEAPGVRQQKELTKPPRARSYAPMRETSQRFSDDDQVLYNELQELNLLSGVASTTFIQWRAGLDSARLKRLIEWGHHNHKIAVISRIPADCDLI